MTSDRSKTIQFIITTIEETPCKKCAKREQSYLMNKGICQECTRKRQQKYRESLTWPQKELQGLKVKMQKRDIPINWTERDYKMVFSRCSGRCVITGEDDKGQLTIASLTPGGLLHRDTAVVLRKTIANALYMRNKSQVDELIQTYLKGGAEIE